MNGEDGAVIYEGCNEGFWRLVASCDVCPRVPKLSVAHREGKVEGLLAKAEVQLVQILGPELVTKDGKKGVLMDMGEKG